MTGIDIPINLQKTIFSSYLGWTGALHYGRVDRNFRNDAMIPETWLSGNEYGELLLNDKIPGLSFFDVVERTDLASAIVDIYFAVNVNTLHSYATERRTEYCLQDALRWIQRGNHFTILSFSDGYDSWKQWGMVKKEDNMHPFYLFKIRTKVTYSILC